MSRILSFDDGFDSLPGIERLKWPLTSNWAPRRSTVTI